MNLKCDYCKKNTDTPMVVQSGNNVVEFLCDDCLKLKNVKHERIMDAPYTYYQKVCQVCNSPVKLLKQYYNSEDLLLCYWCLYKTKLNQEPITSGYLSGIKGDSDIYKAPEECLLLAKLFLHGVGVNRDHEKASKYFKIAAENGDAEALYLLGCMYTKFYGGDHYFVEKNDKFAFECLSKSAEMGYYKAQDLLSDCYADSTLVDEDIDKSIYWANRAIVTVENLINNGNKSLYLILGNYLKLSDVSKAKKALEEGIKFGSVACMYDMALILLEEGDEKKAFILMKNAARLGEIGALQFLKEQGMVLE